MDILWDTNDWKMMNAKKKKNTCQDIREKSWDKKERLHFDYIHKVFSEDSDLIFKKWRIGWNKYYQNK